LVEEHLTLALWITAALKRRYPWIDKDDLHSYSLWGLTLAARSYTPGRGVPFASFACSKALFLAIDAMREDRVLRRQKLGRDLPGVYLYQSMRAGEWSLAEVADSHSGEGERRLEARDMVARVLGELRAEDRRLLVLYYASELTFREIAKVMNTCESTICLHHKALLARVRRIAATRCEGGQA
jgi:RNA polymerase sigma factor (sigma-70 family)